MKPGVPGSGGRVQTAKVIGPRFNPGWLPVFRRFSEMCLGIFHRRNSYRQALWSQLGIISGSGQ